MSGSVRAPASQEPDGGGTAPGRVSGYNGGMARALRALGLAALLLAAAAGAAEAAVVYLTDGSRVEGTIVSATARDVQVYTADGRTVRLDASRIARIDYQPQAPPGPAQPAPPSPARRRPPPQTLGFGESGQEFSFSFGFDAPVSDLDLTGVDFGGGAVGGRPSNGDVGPLLGLQYLYLLDRRLGVGGEFDWLHRGETASQSGIPFAQTDVSGDSVLFLALAKYSLLDHGGVRPYLAAGVGGHRTTLVVDATPNLGFSWSDTSTDETRRLYDAGAWGLAAAARVGVDFSVLSPSLFSLEIGWTGMTNGRYSPTSAGSALGLGDSRSPLQVLTFAGRWGWRF